MASTLIVLLFLLIGSMYYPTIQSIEIVGNVHHSDDAILALADVSVGEPFLWVTAQRVDQLSTDAWVASLKVTRTWPHNLKIELEERIPVIVFHDIHNDYVYAMDGTLLYGVPDEIKNSLVTLQGWGDSRLNEALLLTQLLADFDLIAMAYSPQGFDIRLAQGRILTPSVNDLKTHWAGFINYIANAHKGSQLAVYPWGVSINNGR